MLRNSRESALVETSIRRAGISGEASSAPLVTAEGPVAVEPSVGSCALQPDRSNKAPRINSILFMSVHPTVQFSRCNADRSIPERAIGLLHFAP